jgi:GNAT superfamily N-acetyltransferase
MDRMHADRFAIAMTEAQRRLSTGLPSCWLPNTDNAAAWTTGEHGGNRPLMVLDATAGIGGIRRAQGLVIRQLAPHEAPVHAKVAAAAFNCPEEVFLPSPDLIRLDGVRCYVGEVSGQPVATALSVTAGEFSVIRNVATHPFFRRRGFGTAVTARAVADGILAGAAWCCLKASAEGYPLFRNLGFQAIEGRSVGSLLRPYLGRFDAAVQCRVVDDVAGRRGIVDDPVGRRELLGRHARRARHPAVRSPAD